MRIMTTRKLCFYSPDRKEKFETKGGRIIETCPDWTEKDSMFQAAVRAGVLTCLMEMKTKEEVAVQEAAPSNAHEAAEKAEEVKEETVEETTSKKSKKKK